MEVSDKRRTNLSTAPYKGVRDFYPEDKRVQNYIFSKMREVAERFGYAEYDASVLEPAELYETKSGEEIANEQMYVFEDRGGRRVALRPEMTPSLARMVAARRRELAYPLRLYTIANMFRYERPQRGRLREHWQLNCDLIGIDNIDADVEIIAMAHAILTKFGMTSGQFEIRINSRPVLSALYEHHGLSEDEQSEFSKLLDKRRKMPEEQFKSDAEKISDSGSALINSLDLIQNDASTLVEKLRSSTNESEEHFAQLNRLLDTKDKLNELGIQNVIIDGSIVRGFDYYTGMVFEVFDTHPDNNRALFGGGRYDNLLEIFGSEKVPAVGFGMGDVAVRDTLETYGLLGGDIEKSKTDLYICVLDNQHNGYATKLANTLRRQNINVSVDYSGKKIGDQIKKADKDKVPFVLILGEEEVKAQLYKVKKLSDGAEQTLSAEEIPKIF